MATIKENNDVVVAYGRWRFVHLQTNNFEPFFLDQIMTSYISVFSWHRLRILTSGYFSMLLSENMEWNMEFT